MRELKSINLNDQGHDNIDKTLSGDFGEKKEGEHLSETESQASRSNERKRSLVLMHEMASAMFLCIYSIFILKAD